MPEAPSLVVNLPGYPFNNLASVATLADLRAVVSTGLIDGDDIIVDASTTAGDGLGGLFAWNAASLATDNGLSVIKPNDKTSLQAGRWLLSSNAAAAVFTQDGVGAVARTVVEKLRDFAVSIEDFGGIGDAVGDATGLDPGSLDHGTSTTATGTDNITAFENAYNFLTLLDRGGNIGIPEKWFGISRDFIITANNIGIVQQNSRSGGIVGLTSGTFTRAVVRIGGSTIIFGSRLTSVRIAYPNGNKPCLLGIGLQENCVWNDLVLVGTTVQAFELASCGYYSSGAGSAADDPCHKAFIGNIHVVTGPGSTGRGVLLNGCDDITPENWTVTTAVAGGGASVMGSIGIEIGYHVKRINFAAMYPEGFDWPIRITGNFSLGNTFSHADATTIPAPTAGRAVISVDAAATNYLPIHMEMISNQQGDYTNIVSIEPLSLVVAHTDVYFGCLGRFNVDHRAGADGVESFTVDSDLMKQDGRPRYFTDRVYHISRQLTLNSTTPSVIQGNWFYTNNSGATAISNFTNGINGQTITVQLVDANTTIAHGATIKTFGGQTLSGAGRIFVFKYLNGVWTQTGGSIVPQAAISSPSLSAPNANETALKTAVDALRAALIAQGLTL